MNARTRSKQVTGKHITPDGTVFETVRTWEYMHEYLTPGSTPCVHWKILPSDGRLQAKLQPGPDLIQGYVPNFDYITPDIFAHISETYKTINRDKLLTSTGLAIVQMIVEFSDTLELFARKFWRITTGAYAQYQYAIVPLVSDLKNLLILANRIQRLQSEAQFQDTVRYSVPPVTITYSPYEIGYLSNIEYIVRQQGKCVYEDLGAAKWLDALGYYPDLATIWDLTPLSFVVDWFLPVGSFLESLRGGWLNFIPFQGWISVDMIFDYEQRVAGHPIFLDGMFGKTHGSHYQRHFLTEALPVVNRKEAEFETASITQILNTFYLLHASQLTNRRVIITRPGGRLA